MTYKIDDETLNLVIHRVAEQIRTNTLGSHYNGTTCAIRNGDDDAGDAALRADVAARVAKLTDQDLCDALIRATKQVWAKGLRFSTEQVPDQTAPTDNVVTRDT